MRILKLFCNSLGIPICLIIDIFIQILLYFFFILKDIKCFIFKKSNGGKDSTSLSKLAVVGKKIRGFKIYFVNFLLLHQCGVLALDEPTTNLDEANIKYVGMFVKLWVVRYLCVCSVV